MARTRLAAILISVLLAAHGAAAQHDDNPERERAEAELGRVLQEIAGLQEAIGESRTEHRQEQARLRGLDLAIQEVNLRYRALDEEKRSHEAELERLERQREEYLSSLDDRLAQLAGQVRSAYRGGGQSRAKLVLNQDDPTLVGRMLAYYDYVNRAQVAKIAGLREAVARLETLRQSIDAEVSRVTGLQGEQQDILDELNAQREKRSALVLQIAASIESGEADLAELDRNRRDLQALVERLADALADIPDDLGNQSSLDARKGRLPMPLKGPVRHAFGQQRGAGLDWQGWLIGADPGAEVTAVAYGRVAFADWLRGYGLLLIIDHGDGFMTLYGHNESLLREAGEWVRAGETVSLVGSNPGSGQGAYFEIRKDGRAVDPAAWLAR